MATSGSVDFSTTRDTIIQDALMDCGILSEDESPSTRQLANASRKLNAIVKQWMGNADFAPGLKEWARSRATVFLAKNKNSYSLGPTGDHATLAYTRTTLTADATGTTINVADDDGLAANNYTGIVLDDGSLFWSVQSGAATALAVDLTTSLPSQASSGNYVYSYTTKMTRPINILTASLRDENINDTPLNLIILEEYEAIPSKTSDGTISEVMYEFGLTNGTLFVDTEASDVTSQIRLVYQRPIEDFDAATDEPDYPQGWYRPLQAQLTMDLCVAYNRPISEDLARLRNEALSMAQSEFADRSVDYFQPGVE